MATSIAWQLRERPPQEADPWGPRGSASPSFQRCWKAVSCEWETCPEPGVSRPPDSALLCPKVQSGLAGPVL